MPARGKKAGDKRHRKSKRETEPKRGLLETKRVAGPLTPMPAKRIMLETRDIGRARGKLNLNEAFWRQKG
jgi:hypothetical protein